MKIISLNARAGREFNALMEFINQHKDTTDVFCFQEITSTPSEETTMEELYRANLFRDLTDILGPTHQWYFAPYAVGGFHEDLDYHGERWNAMFIKRTIPVERVSVEYIFVDEDPTKHHLKNIQYTTIRQHDEPLTLMNFHGLRTGQWKDDTPLRITQSLNIKKLLSEVSWSCMLLGDYNLNPDTESMQILEEGMKNLITEYNITSTRSKLYRNYGKMHFADYVLISPDISVASFDVPYVEASDHLPLILTIQ